MQNTVSNTPLGLDGACHSAQKKTTALVVAAAPPTLPLGGERRADAEASVAMSMMAMLLEERRLW